MAHETNSPMKDFIRGGQTTLHNFRMAFQILRKLFFLFLVMWLLFFVYWLMSGFSTHPYHFSLGYRWLHAWVNIALGQGKDLMTFALPNGGYSQLSSSTFVVHPAVDTWIQDLKNYLLKGIIDGLFFSLITCLLTVVILQILGRKQRQNKQLRGARLVTNDQLHHLLQKNKQASDLTLANVPLVKDVECMHFLMCGAPGTGKSVCVSELLDHIRTKKQRAIVYDKAGDFVSHYFRPDKDILLNPLDNRCPAWHIWSECRQPSDYDLLAAVLMPMPTSNSQDPFWINAARTIFSAVAFRMAENNERSMKKLLSYLLTANLDTLATLLRDTEAESLVSEKIEKTALSVKSVLATYLKSLKYLLEGEPSFSIRHWVQQEEDDSWLFVTSRADQHETLKPLISAWLEIAGSSLLSLSPNRKRRIWMSLDELPSLHRLPYLSAMLAESRKFGGCLIATMQSIAQLRDIYGANAAEAISGLCSTRIFFRTPEAHTAEWVAKSLGETEIEEPKEGFSYGANTVRDGVSMQHQRVIRPIVLPSEIVQLSDRQAYLRLPGQWPLTRLQFEVKERQSLQLAFVPKSDALSSNQSPPDSDDVQSNDRSSQKEMTTSSPQHFITHDIQFDDVIN